MFHPSRLSGTLARLRVTQRINDSLAYLSSELPTKYQAIARNLDGACRNISESMRISPSSCATYFEIVAALEDDRFSDAETLSNELLNQTKSNQPALAMFTMSASSLGEMRLGLISRHFADGYFGKSFLGEPKIEAVEIRSDQVERALQRMRFSVPELFAEVEETISEIIFANGEVGTDGYTFDGASSLEYWGAIVLNTAIKKTDLQVFEMIAHESGHNTLFGLSPDEFFVYNTDDERHASPLRDDPRPLDGIYHATFVTARMHYAVSRLAASGDIKTAEEQQEAVRLLEIYRNSFNAGFNVLSQHARYTPSGKNIIDETKNYMDRSRNVS